MRGTCLNPALATLPVGYAPASPKISPHQQVSCVGVVSTGFTSLAPRCYRTTVRTSTARSFPTYELSDDDDADQRRRRSI